MATTLYNYINMAENDFDTYDVEYDAEVTVCHIYEENDEYDKFCNGIIKKVDVIKINGDSLIVNWSELINRNMDKFREFSEHVKNNFPWVSRNFPSMLRVFKNSF